MIGISNRCMSGTTLIIPLYIKLVFMGQRQ